MKTKDLKPLHLLSQDVLDSLGVVLTGKEKALKKLKMVKVFRKMMNKKFPIWRYKYKQYSVGSEVITIEVDNKRFKIFHFFSVKQDPMKFMRFIILRKKKEVIRRFLPWCIARM